MRGSLAETIAGTIKATPVEIQGSQAARRVALISLILQAGMPESVASTETIVQAGFLVGKKTPSSVNVDEEDMVNILNNIKYSDATPDELYLIQNGSPIWQGVRAVPRTDNTFYFTPVVQGINNVGVSSMLYVAEFAVEK
jgi:hypothetical protein